MSQLDAADRRSSLDTQLAAQRAAAQAEALARVQPAVASPAAPKDAVSEVSAPVDQLQASAPRPQVALHSPPPAPMSRPPATLFQSRAPTSPPEPTERRSGPPLPQPSLQRPTFQLGPDGARVQTGVDAKLGPARVEARVQGELRRETKGDRDVITASLEARVAARLDAKNPRARLSASAEASFRGEARLSVPAGTKVDQFPNPLDPTSIPPGGKLELNASQLTGGRVEAGLGQYAAKFGVKSTKDVGVAIERLDGDKVRVTVARAEEQNRDLSAQGPLPIGLPVGFDVHGKQADSTFSTATFDLKSKEGQEAYQQFLRSGQLPQPGPGVSDVLERTSSASGVDGRFKIAGVPFKQFDERTTVERQTDHATGVTTVRETLAATAILPAVTPPQLTVQKQFDAQGRELPSERRYQLSFEGRFAKGLGAARGERVEVSLDPAQFERFAQWASEYDRRPLGYSGFGPHPFTDPSVPPEKRAAFMQRAIGLRENFDAMLRHWVENPNRYPAHGEPPVLTRRR